MVKFRGTMGLYAVGTAATFIAFASSAFGAEVTYKGSWECDATPKMNIPMFSAPASAVRDGDRLTVSRVVYKPGTYEETSRVSGTAMIRDGRVAVETASTGGGITGRFSGTVSDMEVVLAGDEHVKIAGRGEDDRACRVSLKRP
jgi:hypothetical protein